MSLVVNKSNLEAHIKTIATTPRPAESVELERARTYVTEKFEEQGWVVTPKPFKVEDDAGMKLNGINLVARHSLFGADENSSKPRYVVGAHLDSKSDSPGADDNGSAVAAMLEIARLLPTLFKEAPQCDLELVAFDLEENGMLGGAFHAACCKQENVNLRGMVSLEMLAYCDSTPGSQHLPKPLIGQYPNTGDFIAVIGNQNSDALVQSFANGLKQVPDLPVETLQVPDNGNMLQASRLSDHSPFWDEGYAALMITDTSFMRNPHYHQMSDTIETLDMDFLTKVTMGSVYAVAGLLG